MNQFPVNPETLKKLEERLRAVGVEEPDLEERFVRSGGPGGQNVNKVSSCVILVHVPSGITVRCQEERSQAMNRYRARQRLAERMEEKILGAASAKRQAIERLRRQKRRRGRRAREKMLADKRHTAHLKESRRPPLDET
ncbi:MAG: peptide chain release factor-like protein [Elusimicrobia bacterium]|nr:peptide chain release factor-like protein [Elusimicrobiota bacterium]MBP9127779.1 peptide chain release factor-like protein [Elusimicrobiota bacterium]MBP9699629.1 peptide chain release factor-like protein [Elusimicrobiota bacterium]